MSKIPLIFGLFAVTPLFRWPNLAWYLLAWLSYRLLRLKLGQEHVLVFRRFKAVVDVRGRGGLVFLHEILARGIYDIKSLREDKNVHVVFDAGANCGFFALGQAADRPDLRLFCFEPHPATFQHLVKNIAVNGFEKRVRAVQAAVGATCVECAINVSEESSMAVVASSAFQFLEAPKIVTVPMTSLDGFAEAHNVWPDYLKIDVEGFEAEVLRGARRCLEHARWVLLEYHSEKLKEDCVDLLAQSGFKTELTGNSLLLGQRAKVP